MNLSAALPFLPPDSPTGQRMWVLDYEGLSPEWAFLIFLVLVCFTICAYKWCAPGVGLMRKIAMISLRLLSFAVILLLLTKPILRITEQKSVKQPIAVLVDSSQSMKQKDRREKPVELGRAAIASGLIEPTADPAGKLSATITGQVKDITREELVRRAGNNLKLNLWPRIATQADLSFYRFGATAVPLGTVAMKEGEKNPKVPFPKIKSDEPVTAIGEAVRQVIQEPRSQPLGAIVLITDGGSNQGSSPLEAAQIAREQEIPILIYGVGVTSPPDLEVKEITTRSLSFINEQLEVKAKIRSRNLEEKEVTLTLKADGENVGETKVKLSGDSEREVTISYIPQKEGEVKLEVSTPAADDEADKDNNSAKTTVRITDRKFKVLVIEQEPRWDFRYLLDYLQRDPRLEVKVVMIDGEPGLDKLPNSPFLPALPDTREGFFNSQVLILGDVSPEDLGEDRMKIIAEWVEGGGGIIFLSGAKYNPASYIGTPLEPLLPIIPADRVSEASEPEPLNLTAAGHRSPYLQMDPDPVKNDEIWKNFPGVRWVTPVAGAKPGAEVLLEDPRPSGMPQGGALPIFAMQGYGTGKSVYFGTDETYRWRSKTGEKYYSILWGQIMQTLALQLLEAASQRTQLRADRKNYVVGERLIISGLVYKEGYEMMTDPELEGILTRKNIEGEATTQKMTLLNTGKNSYKGEYQLREPGNYTFHTAQDPEGELKFTVISNNPETTQTPLDVRMLQSMAQASGGRFLREEDLIHLPEWISATTSKVATYRKVELYFSIWGLVALAGLLCSEWFVRRMARLK